jgi:hypothetical protein
MLLLRKLLEDGTLLYRRRQIKEAAHRFNYALRKCSLFVANDLLTSTEREKLRQFNCTLLLGLARTKRKQADFDGAIECEFYQTLYTNCTVIG